MTELRSAEVGAGSRWAIPTLADVLAARRIVAGGTEGWLTAEVAAVRVEPSQPAGAPAATDALASDGGRAIGAD